MASAQSNSPPAKSELSPRNKFYSEISPNLSEEQVKSLRAMLITDHHLCKARIENATPHEMFNMLEDDGEIGEGNLGLLEELLTALNETQLARKAKCLEGVQTDMSGLHSKFGFKVEELKPKGGGKTIKGSSIPLILPNDLLYNVSTGKVEKVQGLRRGGLQVVPEALELLEGIEEPVSVISICGPSRSGKSYILSRLLGKADAFELGDSMDPQTVGIWMGTKVLRGKEFTIVLLDTEGIDAANSSAGQDARILVMTTLLSTHFIYNSLNVPLKTDLEKMQCFIQLSKGITVKQGEESDVSAFREFFPNFLWLLRDVSLKTVDEDGKDIDPTEFLTTRVLGRHGDDDDDSEESTCDKVGRTILTFFPSVECTTLEMPSGDREVLNNIAQYTARLKPEFNKGVEYLIEKLLLKSRAKKGYGKVSTVNGEALSIMTKQYVEAVNDPNSIPDLDSAWQNTVEVLRGRAIEEAVVEYNKQMQNKIAKARRMTENGEVPLEEDETTEDKGQPTLMSLHNESSKNVTAMLLKKVGRFGISSENQGTAENNAVVNQMRNRLVQREEGMVDYLTEDGLIRKQEGFVVTGGELLQHTQQNKELSRTFCQYLFDRMLGPIREHLESPSTDFDVGKLKGELTDARQKYKKQARGPEKSAVWLGMTHNLEKLEAKIEYESKIKQEQQWRQEAELRAKDEQENRKKMERQMEEFKKQQAAELQVFRDLQNAEMEKQTKKANERLEEEIENMKKDFSKKLEELNDRDNEKPSEAKKQRRNATDPPPNEHRRGDRKCTIL